MKGKRLIVIMAIIILIFTIQASCAFENDNDFNLTQTTDLSVNDDLNSADIQVSVDNNDTVISDADESSPEKSSIVSVKSQTDVLGLSNNNELLSTDRHVSSSSLQDLMYLLRNVAQNGDNIFLDGRTFTGDSSIGGIITKNFNIYGGSSVDDTTRATVDLSDFSREFMFQFQNSASTINGIDFINYNKRSATASSLFMIGTNGAPVSSFVINSCNFRNITMDKPGVEENLLRFYISGNNCKVINCNFTDNCASNLIHVHTYNNDKYVAGFSASNNKFINNKANPTFNSASNGLGLCIKLWTNVIGSYFENNTFINNTNAVHGAAYCLMGRDVTIVNNYLEGNGAVYGSGIEAHNGEVKVYNTTFLNNYAKGNHSFESSRDGSGSGIAFIGNDNYVYNCTFIGNDAASYAGAIDIVGANTKIENSRFFNNTAQLYGGAVHIVGINAVVSNSDLRNNTATIGGAVQIVGADAQIIRSNFTNNNAVQGAACYIDGLNSSIQNSRFADNNATHNLGKTVRDSPSLNTAGGAIFVRGDNSTIIGNTFTDNDAHGTYGNNDGLGGALYIYGKNVDFKNDVFNNNTAILGGAVYIEGDNIDAEKLNFTDNQAIQGGAVYIEGNDVNIKSIGFENNSAIQSGAIFIEGNDVEVYHCDFNRNNATRDVAVNTAGTDVLRVRGGAIGIGGTNTEIYNNNFTNNLAKGTTISGGHGGAVYVRGDNTTIYDNIVTKNEAVEGGAIFVLGSNSTIKNMDFISNNAVRGGAITVKGTHNTIENNTFYDNNATHNLAFTLTPAVLAHTTVGGAISADGNLTLIQKNNFTYNAAIGLNPDGGHGGAIGVKGDSINVTDNYFTENEAVLGGAVYIIGTNTLIADSNITRNNAIQGGAIYVNGVNANVTNINFTYNNATHDLTYTTGITFDSLPTRGGAISIEGNNTSVTNVLFDYNTAIGINTNGGLGGAIAINGYNSTIDDVNFINNQAIIGGAIYINGTLNTLNYTNFTNNSAIRGGAVFNKASNTTIVGSKYENNSATHDLRFKVVDNLYKLTAIGGAVAIKGASINVTTCEFFNNTAIGIFKNGGLGGAIAVNGSDNYIFNSTFRDNEAIKGGAFYLEGNSTKIYNSTFSDNNAIKGGAGYIDGENSSIEKSAFDDNDARHDLKFTLSDVLKNATTAGGAIYITGNNVNVTSSNFTDNDAKAFNENVTRGGGAFYIEGNNANISDSYFENNTALKGGAVFITGNCTNIYDSNFTRNSVTHFTVMEGFGGAVYLENSHDSDFTRCNFENNTASINGGAIDWHEGATGGQILNCTFTNNTAGANAGAVFWFGKGGIIKGSNFTENKANGTARCVMGNSGDGGAIMWTGSDGIVDDCNFINNTGKDHGGAVFLRGIPGRADCNNNSFINCNFENNSAGSDGGAIDWHQYATNGNIENSTFNNNVANRTGGAVYWNGETGRIRHSNFTNNVVTGTNPSAEGKCGDGGAITWIGSDGLVDDCRFINNTAPRTGGAVYLESSDKLGSADNTTFVNSHFENNTAGINGGAIDWHEGATNGRIENSSFVNNTAKANGGAVFWFGTNGTIANSNFSDNRALGIVPGTHDDTGDGGAVIWTGSNGTVDNCRFVNNSAAKNGGAVYLRNLTENGCDNTTFSNSYFENNTAGINGGAIDWHEGATNGRIENSSFVNNSAEANGGAVFWFGTNGTIEKSNFTENKALGNVVGTYGSSGDGGAVIWTGSNGNVDDCRFINNTAAYRGGAVYLRNLTENGCNNTVFSNSYFENNTAGTNGGAIDWHEGATNGRIENSTFNNNTAHRAGGAVYWNGESGTIIGSNFTNNEATGKNLTSAGKGGDGGAIVWIGSDGLVDDCAFENNTAKQHGGAVYLESSDLGRCDNTTFSNSHFENNLAGVNGGAIDWHEGATNGRIENSTFNNNTAESNGGAVFWFGTNGTIKASNFTNNRANGTVVCDLGLKGDGGAIIWTGSNGNVDDSIFENNTAAVDGGAVYLRGIEGRVECNNTTFVNSKFINNTASNEGGAIDWNEGATHGEIINSTFEKNNATDGGAVSWTGHYGEISGSNFTDNHASRNGGAVRWLGLNGEINDSRFVNNTAANGGAVYLQNCAHGDKTNVTIKDSYFENNSATNDGGAINWLKGSNATVDNSKFVNNDAVRGGALFINGTNGNVKNSNFTSNEAILGGAVYLNNEELTISESEFTGNAAVQGGAVFADAQNNFIKYSNFTNNNATYTLRKVNTAGNSNKTKGGALYIADENNVIENSRFRNNSAVTERAYNCEGNDPSASDDGFGGAVFVGADNTEFTSNEFNDNRACNGSALYNDASDTVLKDDTFIKNQAWSYRLDANVTKEVTHYGDNVEINIANYTGGDNIVNGIYNAKSVNDITFNNVKYLINSSESNIGVTAQAHPVSGAENSNDGALLYQDSLERYQKIIVEITDDEDNVVRTQEVRTDVYGNSSFNLTGFLPGTYTVKAYHPEDRNYKYIGTLTSFEVMPYVDISITKTADYYYTIIGDNVTFTITVNNAGNSSNATLIEVKDIIPADANLELLDYTVTNGTFNSADYTWSINRMNNGTSETLTLTFKTTALGNFNNKVNVECSEDEWNYINNNADCLFEVVIVNLTVNKTADVIGNISVGDDVTFTINVTNNAKVKVSNIVVTDILPIGFKYVTSNDTAYNEKSGLLNIDSLEPGESYLFTITLKAVTNGTLTNCVNVTCKENSTLKKTNASVNVTPVVILSVTKTADFNDYVVDDEVTFTITVTNNGPSNATNIKIKDILDTEGLELLDGYQLDHTVPFLANGSSAEIIIKTKVLKLGDWTNRVNVTCDQNKTNKSANVTVHVYTVDLRVTKTADVDYVPVNGLINFTITVKNHSHEDATGVQIADVINTEVFEIIDTNASLVQNSLVDNVPLLKYNEPYSIWVLVRAKTNGTFENTVEVFCKEEKTHQKDTATVIVYPVVELKVNKTVNVKATENVTVSNDVVFTVNITNTGISNATGVKVTDLVPAGFEFVKSNATGYDNKTGLLTIQLIKPKQSYIFTITLKVISDGVLTNKVNVTCNENKTLVNDSVSIKAIPVKLTVNKIANVTLVANNTLVNFTIKVNNIGIANATEIEVSDILPDGFVFVRASEGNTTEGQKVTWIIDRLNGGNSTKLWIVARSAAVGVNWTNNVNVTCKENKTVVSDEFNVTVGYTNITVKKIANVTVVGNNTLVKFTITVNNTGNVNATRVNVCDVLPDGFVFVRASEGNVTDGQNVTWVVDKLTVGSPVEFWIVARSAATGDQTNVVRVNSTENKTSVESHFTVDVRPVSLTVNKTANVTVVGNNTLVKFTIVVNNTGVMNATGVNVSDVLPDGFAFVSASEGNTTRGQKVSWTIDRLDVRDVREFWIVARTNATGLWINVVTVTSAENKTEISDEARVNVVSVNATVKKIANVSDVANNTLVNFTITVNHTSVINATNVTVKDVLPAGLTFVNATGNYTCNGQEITWKFKTLKAGEVVILNVTARTAATGRFNNTVKVSCHENSTVITENATVNVVEVKANITKTANITEIGNNTLVKFTIKVNYTSNVTATNVTVRDVLPNGFVFVTASDDYNQTGQEVKWHFNTLTKGFYEFWIVARSNATGKWNNVVNASCNENRTIIGDNETVEVVPVNATINKTANVTRIANNTLVRFTISINYTAKVDATNVTIKDILPGGLVFVNATGDYTNKSNEIIWHFDKISKGYFELYVTARSNATGNWTNVVNVSCNENRTVLTSKANVTVVPVNISVIKNVDSPSVDVLGYVNFTIIVTNVGKIIANDISVTDIMDLSVFDIVDHNGTYSQQGNKLVWNIDSLKPDESFTVWIKAKALTNGTFTNEVNVNSLENRTNSSDIVSVKVIPVVRLSVEKEVSVKLVALNKVITFTINVTNYGPSNATDVRIMDMLPDGVEYYGSSLHNFEYDEAYVVSLIEPGHSFVFTVSATAVAEGNWTNTVSVHCCENSTVLTDDAGFEIRSVNLTVVKYPDKPVMGNNSLVNYTIKIINDGDLDATNVFVYDILPDGFEFINATEGYHESDHRVSWSIEKISAKTTVELWISGKSSAVGNMTNQVEVYCDENNGKSNTTGTVKVLPVNLTVNKTAEVSEIYVNGEVIFTINVTNNAQIDAVNVTVTDKIPNGFEFVRSSETAYDNKTGLLIIPVIKAGESYVFTITLKAVNDGILTNVVNVTSNENGTVKNSSCSVNASYVVNLSVEKTADSDDAAIGDVITYTITVKNNGPSDATNIHVVDILDEGLILISGDLEQVIPFLASGNSTVIVIKAQTTAKGTYMNCVNVSCDENDTVKSADAVVHVYKTDLKINKTSNVTDISVHDLVNFTITVKNHGNSNATKVNITDVLDSDFEFVDASGNFTCKGQNIVWTVDTIAGEATYSVWIVVKALNDGNLTNTAHVNCSEEETLKNSTANVTVAPLVDLTVEKTVNTGTVKVGDEVIFTVNVTNRGPSAATKVNITDAVPSGFEFVDSSAEEYDSRTGLLTVPVIRAGESYVFTITLKAIADGTLTNVVNVTCDETPDVYEDSVKVNVTPVVNLTVEKTVDSDDTTIGDIVTYTITVTNNGPSDATNIRITDVLSEGLTLVDGELEQVIPLLENGKSVKVVIKAKTTLHGTQINTVTVRCDENGTVKSANATVNVYIPDLKINKTAVSDEVSLNDLVNYTITVKNHGKSDATKVHITDELSSAFEFIAANGTFTKEGNNIVWTVDRIGNEEVYSVWIVVKALNAGTLNNTAHVNCSEETAVKNSTVSVNVLNPKLDVDVTANDKFVYSGNQTSFTIKISNDGEVELTDIDLENVIPEALIYDHFIGSNWTYDGSKFHYNGSLDVGKTVELTIVVNTTVSGRFSDKALVSSKQTGSLSDSDSVIVYTPDLIVREISNNPRVVVGEPVSFTVVVTNIGDCDLGDVYVVNNFPDGLIYTGYAGSDWSKVSRTLSKAGYDVLGYTITSGWNKDGNRFTYSGILKPGESANYTIYFNTTRVGTFTPEVIANSNLTRNDTDNAYSNNTTVVVEPKLGLKQEIDKSTVEVGETVKIKVTVINEGGCDLDDVYVIENVPEGLKYISFTGKDWIKKGDRFIYKGILAPGENASFEMVFTATKSGNVTNTVTAGSNMTDEIEDDVEAEIVNRTAPAPRPDPIPEPVNPEPVNPEPVHPEHVPHESPKHNASMGMRETGNPIILLILVIFTILPLRRRKH